MTPVGSAAPLQVVVDDRVPGTDWYVPADPRIAAAVVTARLTSADAPELLARDAWNIDGRKYKARDTFGAATVGWLGMVRTAGA